MSGTLPAAVRALGSIALAAILLAAVGRAHADEGDDTALRVTGFGTVGVLHANAPAGWGFLRYSDQAPNDGGTRADVDSQLGLQLNYEPSRQFELAGQVVAAHRSKATDDSDVVNWAFVGWTPNADWSVRMGRVSLDLFLRSDYRNVGFAYTMARPPVEFYGVLPITADGIDVTRIWNLDDAQWRAKFIAGRTKSTVVDLTPGFGISLTRESGPLLLRSSFSRARINGEPQLPPLLGALDMAATVPLPAVAQQASALRNRLDTRGDPLAYTSVGIDYQPLDWLWTAEAVRVTAGPGHPFSAAYLMGGRRFGAWTPYAIASGVRGDEAGLATPAWGSAVAPYLGPGAARQFQQLAVAAADAVNIMIDQRTISLGVRWDVLAQVDIKVQAGRVHINEHGGLLWANSGAGGGSATVASVLVDFIF
jgi:hypothetical protein